MSDTLDFCTYCGKRLTSAPTLSNGKPYCSDLCRFFFSALGRPRDLPPKALCLVCSATYEGASFFCSDACRDLFAESGLVKRTDGRLALAAGSSYLFGDHFWR